jgi:hypothetical protein
MWTYGRTDGRTDGLGEAEDSHDGGNRGFCDYVNTPKNKILHQFIKRRNNLRAAPAMSIELHENTRC